MSNLALAREYAAELEAKLESACDDCERLAGINDELLSALNDLMNVINGNMWARKYFSDAQKRIARAAIAKATGAA